MPKPTPATVSKLNRRTALRAVGGGAALVGAVLATGGTARTSHAESGQHLAGSWQFAIASPGGGAPQFRFLVSFTSDGLAIRTVPLRLPAPPALGVATMIIGTTHGEWVRTSDHQFAVTVVGFAFDETGMFLATQRIRAMITLGETMDSFTAQSNAQYITADGTVIDGGTVPVVGTRIAVEPLAT
ncbi:MAG TPA: hypothetical protein VFD32_23520 [Dehalococcoidia bacterium]|nr:hypothetical protein [Dehalococcoidia bacterium]